MGMGVGGRDDFLIGFLKRMLSPLARATLAGCSAQGLRPCEENNHHGLSYSCYSVFKNLIIRSFKCLFKLGVIATLLKVKGTFVVCHQK